MTRPMQPAVGILGVGVYLPEERRTNDWWPEHIVASWMRDKERRRQSFQAVAGAAATPPGRRATAEALLSLVDDPFLGAQERRVMAEGQTGSDLEIEACRDALSRVDIDPTAIDLVLSYETVPDVLIPRAGRIHHALGLSPTCKSFGIDASCYSFFAQLIVARAMIAAGQARYALISQANVVHQFADPKDPASAWFGDAATAAVVGPVDDELGLIADHHLTCGEHHDCLIFTTESGRLTDASPIQLVARDPAACSEMLFSIADRAATAMVDLCASVRLKPDALDFFASHQATRWMRPVLQAAIGADNARFVDHFAFTGSLGPCNVPLQLAMASREGLLRRGDLVGAFGGGGGEVWGGCLLRWALA